MPEEGFSPQDVIRHRQERLSYYVELPVNQWYTRRNGVNAYTCVAAGVLNDSESYCEDCDVSFFANDSVFFARRLIIIRGVGSYARALLMCKDCIEDYAPLMCVEELTSLIDNQRIALGPGEWRNLPATPWTTTGNMMVTYAPDSATPHPAEQYIQSLVRMETAETVAETAAIATQLALNEALATSLEVERQARILDNLIIGRAMATDLLEYGIAEPVGPHPFHLRLPNGIYTVGTGTSTVTFQIYTVQNSRSSPELNNCRIIQTNLNGAWKGVGFLMEDGTGALWRRFLEQPHEWWESITHALSLVSATPPLTPPAGDNRQGLHSGWTRVAETLRRNAGVILQSIAIRTKCITCNRDMLPVHHQRGDHSMALTCLEHDHLIRFPNIYGATIHGATSVSDPRRANGSSIVVAGPPALDELGMGELL